MNREEIRRLFQRITVWKRGGERAPHKPLLILYALGMCSREEGREVSFREVDKKLSSLLAEFGPSRQSYHPEYPFWRLQNDGIWTVSGAEGLQTRQSNTDIKKSELLRANVSGGFSEPIYTVLRKDKRLLTTIAQQVLEDNFPRSLHDDILEAVGLDLTQGGPTRTPRDPQFRERVMVAYEFRCAVCGFDVRMGNLTIGLEAAHIKWYQAGGPDTEENGLALCVLHHKLFDLGAFTISHDSTVEISERVHGSKGFQESLLQFHGNRLRPPQRATYVPHRDYVGWHRTQVFKGPIRDFPRSDESVA